MAQDQSTTASAIDKLPFYTVKRTLNSLIRLHKLHSLTRECSPSLESQDRVAGAKAKAPLSPILWSDSLLPPAPLLVVPLGRVDSQQGSK